MKGKRIVALILAGCLTFGQTVYAEDTVDKEVETEQSAGTIEDAQEDVTQEIEGTSEEGLQKSAAENIQDTVENIEMPSDEKLEEYSADDTEEVAVTEVKLYTEVNKVIRNRDGAYGGDWDSWKWAIENDNEEVCNAEIQPEKLGDVYYCNVKFTTKNVGEANIKISNEWGVKYEYHVSVVQRDSNIIAFSDDNLKGYLLQPWLGIDENEDGLISKEELAKVKRLDLSYRDITDLEGLQYAENLEEIYLQGNRELKSIEPLLNLKSISYYMLTTTGISTSEKWKIAKFNTELDMTLGDKFDLITNGEFFDDEEYSIEKVNGDDIVNVENNKIIAVGTGTEKIKLSADTNSQIINVKVTGVQPEQEIGEASDSTIKENDKYTILDSNGELWQVYPEAKKVGKDVKRYIGGWIYSENNTEGSTGYDRTEYAYKLYNDDTLWSGTTKLAENVKKFSGHYALDKNGRLIDLYNTEATTVEGVTSWVECLLYDYDKQIFKPYCFILKTDGTLWKRVEVEKGSSVNKFEKIAENVKALNETYTWEGYLDNSGNYTSFSSRGNLENVDVMPVGISNPYYIGTDGHTYFKPFGEWIDLGEMKIVDCFQGGVEHGYVVTYILNDLGEIYKSVGAGNGFEKIIENAQKIQRCYDSNHQTFTVYQGVDGLWRNVDDGKTGTKENPIIFSTSDVYALEDYGVVGDYNLTKNGVLILNHVREIVNLGDRKENQTFAIRTDGTLWNITGIPEMVLDLNSGTALTGDVNGDGEVNIQDLRLILRHVCGKEEFNTSQQNLADVDANGVVDIQDLRTVLRYVCGKEVEL